MLFHTQEKVYVRAIWDLPRLCPHPCLWPQCGSITYHQRRPGTLPIGGTTGSCPWTHIFTTHKCELASQSMVQLTRPILPTAVNNLCTSFIVSQHKTQLRAFLWSEDLWAPLWLRRRSYPGQDFARRLLAAITSSWTWRTGPNLDTMEALISLKCAVQ